MYLINSQCKCIGSITVKELQSNPVLSNYKTNKFNHVRFNEILIFRHSFDLFNNASFFYIWVPILSCSKNNKQKELTYSIMLDI